MQLVTFQREKKTSRCSQWRERCLPGISSRENFNLWEDGSALSAVVCGRDVSREAWQSFPQRSLQAVTLNFTAGSSCSGGTSVTFPFVALCLPSYVHASCFFSHTRLSCCGVINCDLSHPVKAAVMWFASFEERNLFCCGRCWPPTNISDLLIGWSWQRFLHLVRIHSKIWRN